MNKYKYFRVKKITRRNGTVIYKVQAVATLLEMIFGMWDSYEKENETLVGAKKQIGVINEHKIEVEKVVYKKTVG